MFCFWRIAVLNEIQYLKTSQTIATMNELKFVLQQLRFLIMFQEIKLN